MDGCCGGRFCADGRGAACSMFGLGLFCVGPALNGSTFGRDVFGAGRGFDASPFGFEMFCDGCALVGGAVLGDDITFG